MQEAMVQKMQLNGTSVISRRDTMSRSFIRSLGVQRQTCWTLESGVAFRVWLKQFTVTKPKSSTLALARTVINAWSRYNSFDAFYNVYKRWDKVLSLIIAANGDNTLVDSARRELMVPIVMAPPPRATGIQEVDEEDECSQEDLEDLADEDWFGDEDEELR
jgi:hypothetical protein